MGYEDEHGEGSGLELVHLSDILDILGKERHSSNKRDLCNFALLILLPRCKLSLPFMLGWVPVGFSSKLKIEAPIVVQEPP